MLIAGTEAHIAHSKWWPKVSELRESCAELSARRDGVPTAFEAWAEVTKQVRRCPGQRNWSNELIPLAMDGIGGMQAYGLSPVDQTSAWRARFYQSYESLIKRERYRIMLPVMTRSRVGGALTDGGSEHEADADGRALLSYVRENDGQR